MSAFLELQRIAVMFIASLIVSNSNCLPTPISSTSSENNNDVAIFEVAAAQLQRLDTFRKDRAKTTAEDGKTSTTSEIVEPLQESSGDNHTSTSFMDIKVPLTVSELYQILDSMSVESEQKELARRKNDDFQNSTSATTSSASSASLSNSKSNIILEEDLLADPTEDVQDRTKRDGYGYGGGGSNSGSFISGLAGNVVGSVIGASSGASRGSSSSSGSHGTPHVAYGPPVTYHHVSGGGQGWLSWKIAKLSFLKTISVNRKIQT